ncbi:MAG: hypothetical protein GOV15_03090 [Candidatus Diapherotrites archaeon]|nr:hypothetical protein [Candidatus Diapherotrites archaeon]
MGGGTGTGWSHEDPCFCSLCNTPQESQLFDDFVSDPLNEYVTEGIDY